ncbi:MAG TPA: hypothetical protein VN605_03780, partial [Thermoanaerobaculia bacterium]|nr:hypothetical protein [Thermoanaerobaculia bacterium]
DQMQQRAASAELEEVRREIAVLATEIESLKHGEQKAATQADTQTFGFGAAASKVYRAEPGVSFGGYGEFLYENPSGGEAAHANVERAVLYTGYKFNPRVLFNSELEVEGASTERGGQVSVEFAYLDYLIRPEVNVRAGLMLMPVGLLNEQHEPTAYFGALRPRVEHDIIPATWGDFGAGVFGDVGRVSYRAYVTTGLDSAGFGSEESIREGRQAGAGAIAEDWAAVGRVDWHPLEGTMFGGSLYSGNSGQAQDYNAKVTLTELHADSKFRGTSLRALWTRGTLGDAARVNEANGLEGEESVGKSFGGWYVEGGYDLAALMNRGNLSLTPYVRYERLDTQRSVPSAFARNPESDRRITTIGVAFKPIPQTVLKLDWQRTKNRARTGNHQFNVGLGYIF